jgi:chromosome segregation protein
VQATEQAEARVAQAALETARQKLARAEAEARRIAEQMEGLGDEAPLVEALRAASARREAAEARLQGAGEAIAAADGTRQQAAAARDEAESEAAAARAAQAALQSEAQALIKAVESSAGDRAINHVKAEPGFERALAAALGEDLDAAIQVTRAAWAGAAPDPGDPALPPGCASLADHVQAPDALLRRLRQIGVADTDDGAIRLAVGQRLVTIDGRLRRWDGYVATGLGAAAAERLIRVNRLAEIEQALPSAAAKVETAERRSVEARAAMDAARDAAEAGRRAEAEAAASIREAAREEDSAKVEMERLELRRTGLAERGQQTEADLGDARTLGEAETVFATFPTRQRPRRRLPSDRGRTRPAGAGRVAPKRRPTRSVSADRLRAAATGEQTDWQTRAAGAGKRLPSSAAGSPKRG